jgi:TatD DNase family protein
LTLALVDTHAHLDGADFAADLDAVLERARAAGLAAMISAGQDEATSRATLALAERYPQLAPAVGVHPHLAKDAKDLGWLRTQAQAPPVVAVGETGLDYHYDFSPRATQRSVFAAQLDLAAELGLPAIVHCREAIEDVMRMLEAHRPRSAGAVVHCFTESYDVGKAFIDRCDAFLGIGGAVTFKKASDLHDAVTRLPLERLVLETDCPYMTPVPYRGKRNEPSYLALTCVAVAKLRGVDPDEIATITTANAKKLFPKLHVEPT